MSDRLNTIFGWLLFAGVVALLLRFATGLVMPETERPENLGYVIQGVETGAADAGPSLATLLAMGDAAAGENTFAKCTACHTIAQGGANGIGPNLYAVVGEGIAQGRGGFDFSSALGDHGGEWTYENLDAWLKSPRAFASGTKMSFAGLSDPQERANVILYLRSNGGGPDLPVPEAAPEPAADDAAAAEGDEAAPEAGAAEEVPAEEAPAA